MPVKKIKGDMPGRVSTKRAAELLGMSELSVQGALIYKALPIGGAWKNPGSDCYTYHVSPKKLGDYLGLTIKEVLGIKEEARETIENAKLGIAQIEGIVNVKVPRDIQNIVNPKIFADEK